MAVVESSLEASTIKPETYTFVPFIPNTTPEATFAIPYETPSVAGAAEEYTEGTAEEPSDIPSSDTKVETITEQGGETEEEVEEMLPTEPDDKVEAGPEEHVKNGKATLDQFLKQDAKVPPILTSLSTQKLYWLIKHWIAVGGDILS